MATTSRRQMSEIVVFFIATLFALAPHRASAAGDTSGIHAFFNDDKNQFVDLWLNNNGKITVKVSNGGPWRPMWVVLHATFLSGNQVIGRKDYSPDSIRVKGIDA